MGNMLRRGDSRWLCTKFEFAFFAGHGISIRALSPYFLALTVNNPYFVQHISRMRFANGIFMLFGGHYEMSL
jgi:hypothetical protein